MTRHRPAAARQLTAGPILLSCYLVPAAAGCCVIAHGAMEAVVKLGIVSRKIFLPKKIFKDDLVPIFEHSWWRIEYERAVRMWT